MSYPAGSTIAVSYSTDWLGTSTVYVDILVETSNVDANIALAAALDAQPDCISTWTGTQITMLPESPATILTVLGIEVATLPKVGDQRTNTAAIGDDNEMGAVVTLGAGTNLGVVSGSTDSDAQTPGVISENFGTADLSFNPLSANGAAADVYTGWTGDYQGDSVDFLPLDADAAIGSAEPTIGVADSVMVPLSAQSIGSTGEISTSSLCTMRAPLMMGSSEAEYSQAIVYLFPLDATGDDAEVVAAGAANLSFSLDIDAYGWEQIPNGANLVSRNAFTATGYGGGQASVEFKLTLLADATGANIGWFEGVIGYA
jgi:hypothetical protein